jgi:hypothetical protein
MIPCENLVTLVEAVNDFVGIMGYQAGLTKSSAEGWARDVKNFREASFSFGSFSFGRAKENEHQSLLQLASGFFIDHFYVESVSATAMNSSAEPSSRVQLSKNKLDLKSPRPATWTLNLLYHLIPLPIPPGQRSGFAFQTVATA